MTKNSREEGFWYEMIEVKDARIKRISHEAAQRDSPSGELSGKQLPGKLEEGDSDPWKRFRDQKIAILQHQCDLRWHSQRMLVGNVIHLALFGDARW